MAHRAHMCGLRASFLLAGWFAILQVGQGQLMSIDLGHEFFKVALMRQGAQLDIVLNGHSKRKTTTAVSFFETVRAFGDDAVPHTGKAPAKVPMFYHSLLGQNFTAEDIKTGGKWWKSFGLGDQFYSYNLGYDEVRGVPTFQVSENISGGEEVLANLFHYVQKLSEDSGGGKSVRDLVVTVPPTANLRQRQAIIAAGEIAGLRVLTLVHEGAAFAVHRAVDYAPEKGAVEHALFFNHGSKKVEVTIVRFESRQAGMVAGKTAPVVTVLGTAVDETLGGHFLDLRLADVMLKKFQAKHPNLADGIVKNPRALRKLLSQAQKTKAILSANKAAPFIVESLFDDVDFQTMLQRDEFERMCDDLFNTLTRPIVAALASANITMAEIQHVELIGGAWRVPKVQAVLAEFFASQREGKDKLHLGQHINGEEGAALGAALIGANASSSFRVKKIFFGDITTHEYAVQVVAFNGSWEKNFTVLYPVGAALGSKKRLSFALEEDFVVRLFEDAVQVAEYSVTGLEDMLKGKWQDYNMTKLPNIAMSVALESSGIITVKPPTATVEEWYWVNVTKEKNVTNSTGNASTPNATADNTSKEPGAEEAAAGEEAKETEDAAKSEETPAATNETAATEDENGSSVEHEVKTKLKKKKHEKKLNVSRTDFRPFPLSDAEIAASKLKMEVLASAEHEILSVTQKKNEMEGMIYGARDKLEQSNIMQVSTDEQRDEIRSLCTELEEWMYEEGATKNDYEERLTKLQNLLGPIDERALEFEEREDLPQKVKEFFDEAKREYKHIQKNMTWVSSNKTDAAMKKQTDFEEWWKKKQEQQKALPLHEAPAYTTKEVVEKFNKVMKEWEKLKKTKKPKEKKQKAGSNDTKSNATQTTESDTPPEAALELDLEATEKEMKEIMEKKAQAVENEDFDAASNLKHRQQRLAAHHAKLLAAKSEL